MPIIDPTPDAPRPPWRALAGLTAIVALVHAGLLLLTPLAEGPRPSPLASIFSTRTIVIAPPAEKPTPAAGAPAPAAAPAPARAVSPPLPAKEPRAAPDTRPKPPRPARAPQPATPKIDKPAASSTPPDPPAPPLQRRDPSANTSADPALEALAPPTPGAPAAPGLDAAAESSDPPASSPSSGTEASTATSAGSSGMNRGSASGQQEGTAPLQIPGSVRLSFAATGQQGAAPMSGVFGELVWLQDGRSYDAQLSLKLLFRTLRSQHSSGVIGPTGIEPTRFSDKRRSEVASHFVRDQGKVLFSNNTPSVPLLPGAQDRLSIVMQIGALMAGDPARYPPGGALAIQTVGVDDADIWIFKVEDDEPLHLPAGDFVARRLVRNPRKPFDDKLELWLAPELGWLPVRMRQTQANGDFADLQLRDLSR
ncbi:MAG: DUF3108 domain-containing protein [Gammaproteobacteria bacterium]|nr:DUF3108 domain-containing protein [Gammaproteobacteria bacterium]